MVGKLRRWPVNRLFSWLRKQSMKVKTFLAVTIALSMIVGLRFMVKNHNNFFVASEAIHFLGIGVLIYKLTTQNTCSGISLKSQELTGMFLAVRLVCSFPMEADIHTFLDFVTLVSTLWVIYIIRYKFKSSYMPELDNTRNIYLVVPCAILAVFVHPYIDNLHVVRMMWGFCVYLEAISVWPQLRMMQNAKMIEPSTAHYVFALGVARFLACAHWIIQVYESGGRYIFFSRGYFWRPMVLLSEIVQTFILADFCYYYIKSAVNGRILTSMPLPV